MSIIRIIIFLFSLSLVSSCGFELQNTSVIGEKINSVVIKTNDPYSIFNRKLRNQFRNSGTRIADINESKSVYILTIILDESEQRVLSVSANNIPREYEIYYQVEWSFSKGDEIIIESENYLRTQDYIFDQKLLLGKSNEAQVIKEALAQDIVEEIISRLNEEDL